MLEAPNHPLNRERGNFVPVESENYPFVPQAAPKLSRTPGKSAGVAVLTVGQHSEEVMRRFQVPAHLVSAYRQPRL